MGDSDFELGRFLGAISDFNSNSGWRRRGRFFGRWLGRLSNQALRVDDQFLDSSWSRIDSRRQLWS
ncbi:hypothetical protein ACLOJK_036621 [Asimina triloba]